MESLKFDLKNDISKNAISNQMVKDSFKREISNNMLQFTKDTQFFSINANGSMVPLNIDKQEIKNLNNLSQNDFTAKNTQLVHNRADDLKNALSALSKLIEEMRYPGNDIPDEVKGRFTLPMKVLAVASLPVTVPLSASLGALAGAVGGVGALADWRPPFKLHDPITTGDAIKVVACASAATAIIVPSLATLGAVAGGMYTLILTTNIVRS